MTQEQKAKSSSKQEETPAPVEAKDLTTQPLADAIDEILDEIDEVLEENAEEFVRSYVQKGGQ